MTEHRIDEVGRWTEIKLQIIEEYARAYATILNNQPRLRFDYIDGFAGAGTHISKTTGEKIPGSPTRALNVTPKFNHYHFIDMDGQRAGLLNKLAEGREDVTVYEGDCNDILINDVFPKCRYEDYIRALCLLDPYNFNPKWEVVKTAGEMGTIEIFLIFMIMDVNRNVLRRNSDKASPVQIERMNAFWGDDSWKDIAYHSSPGLFADDDLTDKAPNKIIAEAFRKKLKEVAGFKYAPEPIPMVNSKGAVIYYLYFASHNSTGNKIASHIFKKYRQGGY